MKIEIQGPYHIIDIYIYRIWMAMLIHFLVGGIPTPLKNMSSSVGIMKFPIYGKIIFMDPNTVWEGT